MTLAEFIHQNRQILFQMPATGKKDWDKRQTIAEREANRDAARALAARNRGE